MPQDRLRACVTFLRTPYVCEVVVVCQHWGAAGPYSGDDHSVITTTAVVCDVSGERLYFQ